MIKIDLSSSGRERDTSKLQCLEPGYNWLSAKQTFQIFINGFVVFSFICFVVVTVVNFAPFAASIVVVVLFLFLVFYFFINIKHFWYCLHSHAWNVWRKFKYFPWQCRKWMSVCLYTLLPWCQNMFMYVPHKVDRFQFFCFYFA